MNRKDKSGGGRGGRKRKNDEKNTPKKATKQRGRSRCADEARSDTDVEDRSVLEADSAEDADAEISQEFFEAQFPENDDIVTMGVNEDEENALAGSINQDSSDEEGEITFNSSQENSAVS